ncbi:HAMP domain-containing histidine kinase [Acidicapsa acidisoli]|uniref:HAMP domain-containing histidine kinase n=1 Tax=Acidicapsa acidisoli TaxID=1615681 RepID=UPI0021DF7477|nr:HAMP domain-containing histidine kinase [Acidicapsa acidisoli]
MAGEVEVLGDVAARTPKDALYGRVVREVAELAGREVPNKLQSNGDGARNDSVFFLQAGPDDSLRLWVGTGTGEPNLRAIRSTQIAPDHPTDLRVSGFTIPFRVASVRMQDGSRIYLGLSERDELRVLRSLRSRFFLLWLLIVLLGFLIVFFTTRRMLSHVRRISEAASRIGHSDIHTRVPTTGRNDEVAHLALTLNGMLDRIENSMHQLHSITDSLAHDLRSPLTAIRGQLEMSLTDPRHADPSLGETSEPIVTAIEELDRLTEFLNTSLDVAEAKADALRLTRTEIDLDDLLRSMVDLYEPCMSERGLRIRLISAGSLKIEADAALIHRMIANLLDNELKHLPAGCVVTSRLQLVDGHAELILEDNGPGFDTEISAHLFECRVKGKGSKGHGLGLAFVEAVARTHSGTVEALNRSQGGAMIQVRLPLSSGQKTENAVSRLATAN